jgi:Uma2 family endonuclease
MILAVEPQMVEVTIGSAGRDGGANGNSATWDMPYLLRVYGVTEAMFDELVDEDTKAELIDGVMIVHSSATLAHDEVGGFVRGLMDFYADERDLGKVLGPDSLVDLATCRRIAPDAYFLRKKRVPRRWPKEFDGAPDLAVEILSPSNRDFDLEEKRPAYRAAGVGEIWLIDPENQRVLVDRKRRRKYDEQVVSTGRIVSDMLQGFWLDAAWLWSEPLPNKMECLREILGGRSRAT